MHDEAWLIWLSRRCSGFRRSVTHAKRTVFLAREVFCDMPYLIYSCQCGVNVQLILASGQASGFSISFCMHAVSYKSKPVALRYTAKFKVADASDRCGLSNDWGQVWARFGRGLNWWTYESVGYNFNYPGHLSILSQSLWCCPSCLQILWCPTGHNCQAVFSPKFWHRPNNKCMLFTSWLLCLYSCGSMHSNQATSQRDTGSKSKNTDWSKIWDNILSALKQAGCLLYDIRCFIFTSSLMGALDAYFLGLNGATLFSPGFCSLWHNLMMGVGVIQLSITIYCMILIHTLQQSGILGYYEKLSSYPPT